MASARQGRLIFVLVYVCVFSLLPSCAVRAQYTAPPDPAPGGVIDPSTSVARPATPARPIRDVSPSLLPSNFLRDQQYLLLFPRELAQGRHWAPTITVAAATVALLSADPHVQPYFAHTRAFRGFDRVFSSRITGMETIAVPAAFYAIGFQRHDSYMQKTALFSVEAIADTEVVRAAMNTLTKRWRPQDVFNRRSYSDTFFHSVSHIGSSFPSGHTIVAVSVATVIARRYRSQRWVPWVAYGFAGAISLSRITLRAHFPSDVVLGTVLGYAIARYEVMQNR